MRQFTIWRYIYLRTAPYRPHRIGLKGYRSISNFGLNFTTKFRKCQVIYLCFNRCEIKRKIKSPNCPFQPHGTGLKEINFGRCLILLSAIFDETLESIYNLAPLNFDLKAHLLFYIETITLSLTNNGHFLKMRKKYKILCFKMLNIK